MIQRQAGTNIETTPQPHHPSSHPTPLFSFIHYLHTTDLGYLCSHMLDDIHLIIQLSYTLPARVRRTAVTTALTSSTIGPCICIENFLSQTPLEF